MGILGDIGSAIAGGADHLAGSTDEAVARSFDDEKGGGIHDGATSALTGVQDVVRAGSQLPYGTNMDEEEFAKYSARRFEKYNDYIAAPGDFVGKHTDGSAVDNWATTGAQEALEGGYEMVVEDSGAIAYGTLTGANLRTNNPERATGGYTPGYMDSAEIALVAAGPAFKAGVGAFKGFKYGDEVAAAADDAIDAADPAVSTSVGKIDIPGDEGIRQALKIPDQFKPGRLEKGAVAATAGFGAVAEALGLDLGAPNVPPGFSVDQQYEAAPGGTRLQMTDNADEVMGYVVAVADLGGGNFRLLVPSGSMPGSGQFDTKEMRLADIGKPHYRSAQQADNAYEQWADAQTSGYASEDPSAGDRPADNSSEPEWGEVTLRKELNFGWNLYEQAHRYDPKVRYFVAGQTADRKVTYLSPEGSMTKTPVSHTSVSRANAAYDQWRTAHERGNAAGKPDSDAGRPSGSTIAEEARETVAGGGVLESLKDSPLLLGGATAVLGIAVYLVYTRVMK